MAASMAASAASGEYVMQRHLHALRRFRNEIAANYLRSFREFSTKCGER